MADYQVVDREQLDADMADVADRIRAKAEISTPLAWPDGYKAAVDAIQTGVELPELTNPGDASKLLAGYQLIDSDGAVVDGNIPTVDAATPGVSVQANGDVVAYVDQAAGYTTGGYKTYKQPQDVIPAQTITPGTEDQVIPAYHYLTGKQTIKGDPNLVPENIVKGATIFDVEGAAETGGVFVEPESKDVDFYDYDGTRLYSYTLEEVQALTELPPLPSHDGLVCQGWNWTLDEIKTVETFVDVGALYLPSDGKTHIYISLPPEWLSPTINFQASSALTVTVNWGDGTEETTSFATNKMAALRHDYASAGDYCITIDVVSGNVTLGNGETGAPLVGKSVASPYNAVCKRVFVGSGVIGSRGGFRRICGLETVTFNPSMGVGSHNFLDANVLKAVILPKSSALTAVNNELCNSASSIKVLSIPRGVTTIGTNAAYSAYSLRRLHIPVGVTSIGSTAIFQLHNLTEIYLPNTLTKIGANFRHLWSLKKLDVPASVTTIEANFCGDMYSLKEVRLHSDVPPTLSGATNFTNVPDGFKICVPAGSLEAYQTATNWSAYAALMVGV